MVGRQFFIVAADHLFPEFFDVMDVEALRQQTRQMQKYPHQHLSVIDRPMVVELTQVKELRQCIQLDVMDIRQDRAVGGFFAPASRLRRADIR